ncbi:hypothetical protein GS445_17920 [Rhodococcus hoagii]|nr:hypothetical protein [Prescottella equi]
MYGLWKSKMYYMCGEKPPALTSNSLARLVDEARARGWTTPALIAARNGGEWSVSHWVRSRTTTPVSTPLQASAYDNVRTGVTPKWPHRLGERPTDDGIE